MVELQIILCDNFITDSFLSLKLSNILIFHKLFCKKSKLPARYAVNCLVDTSFEFFNDRTLPDLSPKVARLVSQSTDDSIWQQSARCFQQGVDFFEAPYPHRC